MPAPVLRHYSAGTATFAAANTEYPVAPAVPADRALVIAKLTIAATVACTVQLRLGSAQAPIFSALSLAVGDVYIESNLVVPAGEAVLVSSSVAASVTVNVFGEEVDN